MTKSLGKAKLSPIRELMRSLLSMTIATQINSLVLSIGLKDFSVLFTFFHTLNTVQNWPNFVKIIIPSAPMETNLTPLLAMKSRALLTLAILWNLILPLSGFCKVSPEITSSNSISLRPLRKSSSIFSIWVPALRKCEFTHAVKVWKWQSINRN